jgi:hypothetical protein
MVLFLVAIRARIAGRSPTVCVDRDGALSDTYIIFHYFKN